MTRTCRICGDANGRYWIETPVEKYAEKTFNQLLLELTKIELTMVQAEKLPHWLCSSCSQKLESAYDFVLQAKQTHKLWLQQLEDTGQIMSSGGALECLRETPIHLFEIEGVTIKTEALESAVADVGNSSSDPLVRTRIKKRTVFHFSDTEDDQDDVPLRHRRTASQANSLSVKLHKCNLCGKSFRYITNLYRHKKRDHGYPGHSQGESSESYQNTQKSAVAAQETSNLEQNEDNDEDDDNDNYYKCDQCDKTYKHIMVLIKHKQNVHETNQLPIQSGPKRRNRRDVGEAASPASSGKSIQRTRISTDTLVHSLIKAVQLSDEDGNSGTDNYYKCDQCHKSYKYIVSLIKHKHKDHSEADKNWDDEDNQPLASTSARASAASGSGSPTKASRINRRVQGFDLHRCEPNGAKEIQCMICLRKFTKLRELRDHLRSHPTDFNFQAHGEPIERIAEGFFKTAVESTVEGLKSRILHDLRMGAFGRFYSITNEARYEMSLDSSDTDSDGDADVVLRRSYACELCDSPEARWPRKYQLHEHHRQQHTWEEAPHVCQRCDSRFLSLQLLEHHTLQLCQNTLKRYMCDKCPQRFFWRKNLRAHLVEHKSKQDNYPCDQCQRSFQDKSAVTKHKLMMHREETNQLIPCRWCSRTFYRPALLHKHVERHGFTGEDLPLAETLLADAAKPSGPKTVQCKICDLQFVSVADLRRHNAMLGHSERITDYMISTEAGFELLLEDTDDSEDDTTGGRSYSCDLCQMTFRRRREMSEHQYSLHAFDKLPYGCEHCIYKTVDKLMLEHHLRTQCLNNEKPFSCSRCRYKFMWKENLEQHYAIQHSKQPPTQEQSSMPLRRRRRFRYQCPQCWRSFVVQPSLDKHIRDMHVAKRNPGKKYLCSLCGLESLTPNKLNIHMRRHNGEKPFKCDLCDMRFTVHYELKVHRRKHTGERPYQCTFCDKHFARPDKLRRHVYMHSARR
ncbi:zinc finger protein 208 [Drosophila pseudoobscura]|uniref:Zinc finger protein 208 n=1 Tax=Drosophila pseudoobscura pseudoobscura TaxID=46245 RepID=A0A6I8V3D7_DROPS|nr:zinc finger protein 208 [Drosophila pseudoobscura]